MGIAELLFLRDQDSGSFCSIFSELVCDLPWQARVRLSLGESRPGPGRRAGGATDLLGGGRRRRRAQVRLLWPGHIYVRQSLDRNWL